MSRGDRMFGLLWGGVAGASSLLFATALWLGALNQDEGWYLYAGRLAAEGYHPFIDFASTQGPVMTYTYALAQPLVRVWGVAGGRLFTALLGMLALAGTASLAYRLSDRSRDGQGGAPGLAAIAAFAMLGLNVYHVYYSTVVKTYALTACWLVFGFLALAIAVDRAGDRRAGGRWFAGLAGCLLALAGLTRLSAAAALPGTALTLGWAVWRRRLPVGMPVVFLVAASLTTALALFPFLMLAPVGLSFGLVTFHAARDAGSVPAGLAYKAGFVARLTGFYFLPLLLSVLLVLWRKTRPARAAQSHFPVVAAAAIAAAAGMSAIHIAAPFPYDDYQVIAMPLFVVGLVTAGARVAFPAKMQVACAAALAFVALAHSVASPQLQGWLIGERDRIWWPIRDEFPLQRLRRAARLVATLRAQTGSPVDLLLTQDTYLAVEAGLRVPRGLELGPFSCFPELTDAAAAAIGVVTPGMLESLIASTSAPVAAFSAYGFAIAAPAITELPIDAQARLWAIVQQHYREVEGIEAFGQADTHLRMFVRRAREGP